MDEVIALENEIRDLLKKWQSVRMLALPEDLPSEIVTIMKNGRAILAGTPNTIEGGNRLDRLRIVARQLRELT